MLRPIRSSEHGSENATQFRRLHFRIAKLEAGSPHAFFDINDAEEPRVLQLSASNRHLEPF